MKLFSGFILGCTFLATAFAQTSASGSAGANTATQATAPATAGTAQANSSTTAAAHAGAVVPVELSKSIDSKKAKVGDEVTARVISDVRSGGAVAIPRGSKLLGKVTEANARSKGDATSSLGIVFDRAVFKNGTTLNLVSTIQAVIAPPETQSMPLPEPSSGGAGPEGSSGGMAGGSGSTASAIGNTAGSAVGAVGRTVDSTTQTAAGDLNANARLGANAPVLTGQTTGVVGIKGLELNASTSSAASGSVFTTSSKSVKLENGTRMLVNVSAASKAEATSPDTDKKEKN
jgi:hypothetical protein